MTINNLFEENQLKRMIDHKLKPLVRKIDAEAYYPADFLKDLGKEGWLLSSRHYDESELVDRGFCLMEQTAATCMTTAFNLWCHLAAMTYLRKSPNAFLRETILPQLENGSMLGGTGLSNPMKYYAGLERLCLKATRSGNGYLISGKLPNVSNLGRDHGFGIIASLEEHRRIMAFIPCSLPGLRLKEKTDYLGLNGSATYMCEFNEVFVSDDWIISDDADKYVAVIRPLFVLYQIPLGLGVTSAVIGEMRKGQSRQQGCSRYLKDQPEDLERDLQSLRETAYQFVGQSLAEIDWLQLIQVRLQAAYLALRAVQAGMLHSGGAGYLQHSDANRRLREAYFMANLTPTIKHLEKMIQLQQH